MGKVTGRGIDWRARLDPEPRLPLEPLLRVAGLDIHTDPWGRANPQTEFARVAGISLRSAARAFARGDVSVMHGDRWAAALGYHPTEIWGRAFYAGCD